MRLPKVQQSTDKGYVYVVQRDSAFKVGFSRSNVPRRVRASDGVLLFTVEISYHPAAFERIVHRKFANQRVDGPGFKREWFALSAADLEWIKDSGRFIGETESAFSQHNI